MPTKSPTSDIAKRSSNRSEEHTSELQSRLHLVCRLLLEKKKKNATIHNIHLNSPYATPLPTRLHHRHHAWSLPFPASSYPPPALQTTLTHIVSSAATHTL